VKRRSRIELLLKYAEDVQHMEIFRDYELAVESRTVPEFLPVRIKNLCENLRSVLDYLAQEIWESFGKKAGRRPKIYFPIESSRRRFEDRTDRLFPHLRKRAPELFAFLERIQPFPDSGEEWLARFKHLNNRSKHFDLVLHQSRTAPVGSSAAASLGPVVHLDQRSGEWVEFRFVEPPTNAFMLVDMAVVGVRHIQMELALHLPWN